MPLQVRKCYEHKRIWWNDEKFGSKFNGSLWEPQLNVGEYFFYHVAEAGHEPHKRFTLVGWGTIKDAFVRPVKLRLVWNDKGANSRLFSSKSLVRRSIWQPVPPKGYSCLGMLGLGAEWHKNNPNKDPTAEDFPRFRCVKLDYLRKMEPKFFSYQWRWNSMGSSAKIDVSLYNLVFKQPGLDENISIAIGVPTLDTIEVPTNDILTFDPDFVCFDEKGEVEDNRQAQFMQTLSKTKAVYMEDFWHYQSSTWKFHHFILFSDRLLEYYKDNTEKNTNNPRYDSLVCLELRGSYDLSKVSTLHILKQKNWTKNQTRISNINLTASVPISARRTSTSFRTIKHLFGFEHEPPYIIEMELVDGKVVRLGFDSEPLMNFWHDQLKLFSINIKTEDCLSRVNKKSKLNSASLRSHEPSNVSFTRESEFKCFKSVLDTNMPPKREATWTFWISVLESGMTFCVTQNTGLEKCWNLYAGKDKDRILKSDLEKLLGDYMETRLDWFPATVNRKEGNDFLENLGERALKAKMFLDSRKQGRVIFQEFQKIRTQAFWKLMDERKPVTRLKEARLMWKRILNLLADNGFIGDDEVFEIWERYDTAETGTLSSNNVEDFLRDWIRAIAKLYPNTLGKKSIENFLDTLEGRAQLAMKILDPQSQGLSFARFRKIQHSSFWKHIDKMVSIEISSPRLSSSEMDSINRSISAASWTKASLNKQVFSWNSNQFINSIDALFTTPEGTDVSESRTLRDRGSETIESDADGTEDLILSSKLNSFK